MISKKILYLSEDYTTSKVHHNLCQNVALKGLPVVLFSIHRKHYSQDLTSTFGKIDYEWHIDQLSCNLKLYRTVFPYKMHYKYRKLATEVNLNEVGLCHAATLFSDGVIALKLKKDRGIPYVVSVRGTDTEIYAKWMCHLWPIGRMILREAARVVFISPSLRDSLFEKLAFRGLKEELKPKIEIIPNGIDDVWLKNIRNERISIDVNNPRIIYIGALDQNKNVLSLMNAIDKLANVHPGVRLSIVGGDGSQEERIKQRCAEHPQRYQMLGKIYDKDKLRDVMRQHDIFAMVSHSETFGLVYVEALSQALPILYSQGRGIDGFFNDKIGEAVNPDSVNSIAEGIEQIISHQHDYIIIRKKIEMFSWPELAERYKKIYTSIFFN